MQETRLNRLFDRTVEGVGSWLRNPWRRFSVLLISLLLGNFFGTAVSTIAGQAAEWDIVVAAMLVVLTELVSRLTYRAPAKTGRSLLLQILNAFKIGLIYSLFVEAFKLGS